MTTTFTPFGLTLEDATPKGLPKPLIVTHTLEFLSEHACPAPADLFLESKADETTVKKLRVVFDRVLDPMAPSLISNVKVDPHCVAQLLVWYLRELPAPVIPAKYFYTFMNIKNVQNRAIRAKLLRVMVYKLPEIPRNVVLSVCDYLSESELRPSAYAALLTPFFLTPGSSCSADYGRSAQMVFSEMVIQSSFLNKLVNAPRVPTTLLPATLTPEFRIEAVALYDFAGGQYLLSFKKGEHLFLLDVKFEPGWMQASKGSEVGWIPEAYVDIIPSPEPAVGRQTSPTRGVSVSGFSSRNNKRLSAPPTSLSKARVVLAKCRVVPAQPQVADAIPTPGFPAPDPPKEVGDIKPPVTDWKSQLSEEELKKLPEMMNGREIRAKEIMTSEQSYLEFLKTMTELFVNPLRKNPMGLSEEDIRSVFSNVDVLTECHEKLFKIIESRFTNWNDDSVIGDVFLTNVDFIKYYRYYVNNYEASLVALEKCQKKSEEFREYLSAQEKTPRMRNMKLVSFLVAPVQRVMRYSMLLAEVLKKTPSVHPDREALLRAVAMTKNMAQYINEKKSNVENLAQFQEFLNHLKGLNAEVNQNPRRVKIKEGEVGVGSLSSKMYAFLFSDLLFFTKPGRHDDYSFKGIVTLADSTAVADRTGAFSSFTIEAPAPMGNVTLFFEASTDAEEWFKAIFSASQSQKAFERLARSSSSMRFALTDDSVFSQRANLERAKKQRARLETMIEKETAFGERLKVVWDNFMQPLKESEKSKSPLLRSDKLSRLSTNLNLLITLQPPFIEAMRGRLAEWERTDMFSDIIKNHMYYFRAYVLYLTHFKDVLDVLNETASSSATAGFQFWLIRVESQCKMTLEKEVAEPLNHFPDLFFALQEFSLMTRKDNPDGEELKAMMTKVTAIKDEFVLHASKFKSIKAVSDALDKFSGGQSAPPSLSKSPTIRR